MEPVLLACGLAATAIAWLVVALYGLFLVATAEAAG
jgi:hypothetical protein